MKRRGFIGSIAGLFGLPVAAKAIPLAEKEVEKAYEGVVQLLKAEDSNFRYYDVTIHDDLGAERGRARGKFKIDPDLTRMVLVETLTYPTCTSGRYNIASAKIYLDWIVVPVRVSFGLAIEPGVTPSFVREAIVFDAS